MKVLIVENDMEVQELISSSFKREGHEVEVVGDGLEGLKSLKVF